MPGIELRLLNYLTPMLYKTTKSNS